MAATKTARGGRDRIGISVSGVSMEAFRLHGKPIIVISERTLSSRSDVDTFSSQVELMLKELDDDVIVLDFHNVESVGSMLLGQLIALNKRLHERGGELRLSRLTASVQKVLATSRLDRQLAVYDVLDSATAEKRKKWWWPFGK